MRGSQAHSSPFLKSMKFQQKKKKKRRKREIKRKIYLEHRTNRTLSKDKTKKKKNLRKIYDDPRYLYSLHYRHRASSIYISSYLSLRGKRKLTAEREKERWRNTQIRKFTQQNFNEERRVYERLSHPITLGFRFTSLSLPLPSPSFRKNCVKRNGKAAFSANC